LRQSILNLAGNELLPENITGDAVLDQPPQNDMEVASPPSETSAPLGDLNLQNIEIWAIKEAVKRSNGLRNNAARLLGIDYSTLRRKIARYKIPLD